MSTCSVASSEPSSVGIPAAYVATSAAAGFQTTAANSSDSFTSNSSHREFDSYYHPSKIHNLNCPLCGNTSNNSGNSSADLKTSHLKETTATSHGSYPNHLSTPSTFYQLPTYSSNDGGGGTTLSDLELAYLLQNSETNSEIATAVAIGACGVCISAITDATTVTHSSNKRTYGEHQPKQQQHQSLETSLSTLESFQDEVVGVMHVRSTNSKAYKVLGSPSSLHQNVPQPNHDSQREKCQFQDDAASEGSTTTTMVYIGEYNIHGQRHGPHGEIIWDNGDRYVGTFVNGKRTGAGALFFRDGSSYTGDWFNNQMHGKGQRTFSNGDVYVGTYYRGQRAGGPNCKIKFANGDLYVGNWDSNFFHGRGRYYFADGTALDGTFVHGKKHGKFKRQKPNGDLDILRYEDDQIVGQGVRWNVNRTKTWLLKKVETKRAEHPRRTIPSDSHGSTKEPTSAELVRDQRNCGRRFFHDFAKTSPVSTDTTEPLVEVQTMTMTKKCARIPVAQAVSIGYDCELGTSIRDTNPAFWSVGDFSNSRPISKMNNGQDSTNSFV